MPRNLTDGDWGMCANNGLMQYSKAGACDPVTPALARISCEPDSFRRITRHYTARGYEA